MDRERELERIRASLENVKTQLVAAAAALQAKGADTSMLAQPVIGITDVLAQLELLTAAIPPSRARSGHKGTHP